MTDKHNPWTGAFDFGARHAGTPAEEEFLRDAERIATEVAAMSDEEVADYLVEHGLQDLVDAERIEAVLESTLDDARRRRPEEESSEGPSFAVRSDPPPATRMSRWAGRVGNVVRPDFGARRDKVP